MAKKHIVENWRVEVVPQTGFREEVTREHCDALRKQILRHCDVESAVIAHDARDVCEFCLSIWEDEPWCCNKAIAKFEAQKKGGTQQ